MIFKFYALRLGDMASNKNKTDSVDTFDLPDDISEDDANLLNTILSAIHATEICSSYKIKVIQNGYMIRGSLASEDDFEIELDDLNFISCANHIRIERIALCKCSGKTEMVIKMLNMKQRVMVSTSCSFIANKKRKYTSIPS